MNIFDEANKIVNKRSSEKERQYGDFEEGMKRAAKIAQGCTGLPITDKHMYLILVALKLSREGYNHKQDNILDAIAYLGALDNTYKENQK